MQFATLRAFLPNDTDRTGVVHHQRLGRGVPAMRTSNASKASAKDSWAEVSHARAPTSSSLSATCILAGWLPAKGCGGISADAHGGVPSDRGRAGDAGVVTTWLIRPCAA